MACLRTCTTAKHDPRCPEAPVTNTGKCCQCGRAFVTPESSINTSDGICCWNCWGRKK